MPMVRKHMSRHISFFSTYRTVFPMIFIIIFGCPYMSMLYCVSIYCSRASPPPKISTIRLNISPVTVSCFFIFISHTSFFILFVSPIYEEYDLFSFSFLLQLCNFLFDIILFSFMFSGIQIIISNCFHFMNI